MSVGQCEDAVKTFIVEMSSFVNSYHIWGITKLHHSFGRALDSYTPIVTGSYMDLNCIFEEFKMVRDCLSSNLNIYHAVCNTGVERLSWDRQFAGWSDKDALIHLKSMQRRKTQFPILARSKDYKRVLRASIILCLWFKEIRNHSLLISWKTWENEEAMQCFNAYLQQFISEFLHFSSLLTTNLRHHVQISCNEAFPLLFEMADDFEKRNSRATLRVRSALAAAVYRRAYYVNPIVRNLPRTAYWEILWANTSMFWFSKVASDDSFIESKGLIYPQKLHKLPTSELKISQQDLVSLWNLAASILNKPIWQTHLINIMIKIDLKIKSNGVAWPADLEADRVALYNYIIGCSYAGMGMHDLAIDYLLKVSKVKNELKTDLFLVPFSLMEAAMCHYAKNRNGVAECLVQTAFQQYGHSSREVRMLVHTYDYARRHPVSEESLFDTKQDLDFPEDYPDIGLSWDDDAVAGNSDNINREVPPQQNVGNVDEESVKVEEKPATEAEPTDEAK